MPPLGPDGGTGALGSMARSSGAYLSTTASFTSLATSMAAAPSFPFGRSSRALDGRRLTSRSRARHIVTYVVLLLWALREAIAISPAVAGNNWDEQ